VFRLTRPEATALGELLKSESGDPEPRATSSAPNTHPGFSYSEVGATRGSPPLGYNVDHNRVLLGHGREAFEMAISAIDSWKMFHLGWVEVFPPNPPIEVGQAVAVVVSHLGFWSVNVARIVYTIHEHGEVERYGFAYGTLLGHAEQGEERFTVEYHSRTEEVWYDLFAFSKPRHILARLGYPISRSLQKRFARDSLNAMKQAVGVA
jgi:uncharacterized protein (UPF0548 family)